MSREHHWWPVALQGHWSVLGKVSWIDPNGNVQSKKYANRAIAKKSHGHSIFPKTNPWHTNFETEFQKADDLVHPVIGQLRRFFTGRHIAKVFWGAFRQRLKRNSDLSIFLRRMQINEKLRQDLILVCLSLLVRSPRNRHIWENAGARFGLQPHEDTGKTNMLTQVRAMNSSYARGYSKTVFPLIIYSIRKEFIFGDGLLDTTSPSLPGWNRGCALVPLTPHICIFLASPWSVRSDRNSGFLIAPDWLVEGINAITQVYSRRMLFFASQKPKLSKEFETGTHLQYVSNSNETVESLRDLCGERSPRWQGLLSFREK